MKVLKQWTQGQVEMEWQQISSTLLEYTSLIGGKNRKKFTIKKHFLNIWDFSDIKRLKQFHSQRLETLQNE